MNNQTATKKLNAEMDTGLSHEELHSRIEVAAYYLSKNNESDKSALDNWMIAEKEISQQRTEPNVKTGAEPKAGNSMNSAVLELRKNKR